MRGWGVWVALGLAQACSGEDPKSTDTAPSSSVSTSTALGSGWFDAHAHLIDFPGGEGVDEQLDAMAAAGVQGAFLFGGISASGGRLEAAMESQPGMAYGFAEVPRDEGRQLILDSETVELLAAQLDAGHTGIGELSLHHTPFPASPPEGDHHTVDGEVPLAIFALAADRGVPVNVHIEHEYAEELDRALDQENEAVVIWSHAGDAGPEKLDAVMAEHPNLWIDLSSRNNLFDRGRPMDVQSITDDTGALKEAWASLFERYPERVLVGFDLASPDRFGQLEEVVAYYETACASLDEEVAYAIREGNARRLLR